MLAVYMYTAAAVHAVLLRSYRRLALKYHPDTDASTDASDEFARVCEAYDVLSNRKWLCKAVKGDLMMQQ